MLLVVATFLKERLGVLDDDLSTLALGFGVLNFDALDLGDRLGDATVTAGFLGETVDFFGRPTFYAFIANDRYLARICLFGIISS